jgi:hypothetical protein
MKSLDAVSSNQGKVSLENEVSTIAETSSGVETPSRIEWVYSDKEWEMIRWFGFDKVAKLIRPMTLYNMMVRKAFVDNDTSWWAAGLRRCMRAFDEGMYRGTLEWDDLIYIKHEIKTPKVKK